MGYLRAAQVPQWVQAKALVGYQGGEDPRQKIDLVDFDMLLRYFLGLKLFLFYYIYTNLEKNAIMFIRSKWKHWLSGGNIFCWILINFLHLKICFIRGIYYKNAKIWILSIFNKIYFKLLSIISTRRGLL